MHAVLTEAVSSFTQDTGDIGGINKESLPIRGVTIVH